MSRKTASLSCLLILAASFQAKACFAQTAAEFFQHASLRLIVSASAGGGYDTMARLVARAMGPHLPGNPAITVQNMPGAGGVIAVNHLANVAPRDGSTFALVDRGVLTARILYGEDSKTQFDSRSFSWLGSVTKEAGVGLFATRSGFKTLEDAKKGEPAFGATGLETDPAMYARLLNSLLGTRFKVIPGYAGETEFFQAVEQGETDGMFASGWSGPNTVKELQAYHDGRVTYFIQMSRQRLAELPDTPTILELLSSEADRQMVEVLLSRLTLGTPFIAPPGVPPDRLAILRAAFRATVEDPEFNREVERQYNHVNATFPAEAEKLIAEVYALPQSVTDRLREIVKIAR
jgi:tripartite-type tricarboxylate transporter receptor subunit TctC